VTAQDNNKAWGFSLFADDIRFELGGKTSLMGLYQADMLFPANMKLPFLISKLVIQIMYYEIVGAIDGDVTFRVTYGLNKPPIAEIPVLRSDLVAAAAAMPHEVSNNQEDSDRIFHFRIPVTLSPFAIEELDRIRVRAYYADGAILKLGSIAVKQLPDDQFTAVTGLPVLPPQ
jgi:hypothetical protein